jgi:DNA repair protein RadC
MTTVERTESVGSDVLEQTYLPLSRLPPPSKLRRVASASDAYALLGNLRRKDREHFVALFLNCRHQVIRRRIIAIGSLNGVEIHPRELFKAAIRASAGAIIVAHNHPSGDPTPSRADVELTNRFREVGELVGIPILDHVIVCREGFVSLAERGWR